MPMVTAVSQVYETAPVGGPEDQGAFLNLVVELAVPRWTSIPIGSSSSATAWRRRPGGCERCGGARVASTPT